MVHQIVRIVCAAHRLQLAQSLQPIRIIFISQSRRLQDTPFPRGREGEYTRSWVMRTSSSHGRVDKEASCFLCDEPAGTAGLHNASTYDIDTKVRRCAMELEDTALLAKLAIGDMIALEANYHSKCLQQNQSCYFCQCRFR